MLACSRFESTSFEAVVWVGPDCGVGYGTSNFLYYEIH